MYSSYSSTYMWFIILATRLLMLEVLGHYEFSLVRVTGMCVTRAQPHMDWMPYSLHFFAICTARGNALGLMI